MAAIVKGEGGRERERGVWGFRRRQLAEFDTEPLKVFQIFLKLEKDGGQFGAVHKFYDIKRHRFILFSD